jgi:hypothetical protein
VVFSVAEPFCVVVFSPELPVLGAVVEGAVVVGAVVVGAVVVGAVVVGAVLGLVDSLGVSSLMGLRQAVSNAAVSASISAIIVTFFIRYPPFLMRYSDSIPKCTRFTPASTQRIWKNTFFSVAFFQNQLYNLLR